MSENKEVNLIEINLPEEQTEILAQIIKQKDENKLGDFIKNIAYKNNIKIFNTIEEEPLKEDSMGLYGVYKPVLIENTIIQLNFTKEINGKKTQRIIF